MMENLINDLMDHAKVEQNTFKLDQEYFSLARVIFEAFQMLNFSARERGIHLRAIIDKNVNLSLIERIYGDQRRYL
jgi:signal transduction histidine kinase